MQGLSQDFRYAARTLLKRPMFTAIAILTLALGIVLRIVLRQGLKLALLGVSIGAVASVALSRLTRGVLFGIKATDPLTFAVISMLLVLVALLACIVPARRATRVDPLKALRYE